MGPAGGDVRRHRRLRYGVPGIHLEEGGVLPYRMLVLPEGLQ